jgi:hypothetical protein
MSIAECCLAVEKPKDGKPFTVCEVNTWFYVGIHMLKDEPEELKKNAERLYNLFGGGKDESEKGATLEKLKEMPSNGSLCIIPKSKDKFVKVEDWAATL